MSSKKSVLLKSPAKLNLFLHVINKREDSYHTIESIFVPITWCDEISIECTHDGVISREGDLVSDLNDDLLIKAARLLKNYGLNTFKHMREEINNKGCRLVVKKNIPAGTGLGGGSSNAALTLKTLNMLWNLNLSLEQLFLIGRDIGADVPFFLQNDSCFVSGIGEKLYRLHNNNFLPRYFVLLIPKVKVSTHKIFSSLNLDKFSVPTNFLALKEIQKTTLLQKYSSVIWTYGRNDLEATTIKKYPVVGNALKLLKCFARMHNLPESCCRMSGTGGAVFCSTPTLSIATKISTHIKKIKEKEVIIKICQRLI